MNVLRTLSRRSMVARGAAGLPTSNSGDMTAASRSSGVAPLGVFFDAVNTASPAWSSNIIQPRGFDAQPVNCTGVRITRVSISSALGAGTLAYVASGTTLSWRSGSAIDVSGGGNFTLTCSAGEIDVWVDPASLPVGDESDSITIEAGGLNADWNSFHYAWNFGDSGSGTWSTGATKSDGSAFSKNTAFGWNAAHVYETAGTYSVTLTVTDDEGGTHQYEQTIAVASAPVGGWTTYYFADSGDDDTGDGTIGTPYKTWAKALTLVGANTRLLFNRGDTFSVSTAATPSQSSTLLIGAYGTGAKPIFSMAGQNGLASLGSATDVRCVDLDINGIYPTPVGTADGVLCGDNTLLLRCDVSGFRYGIHSNAADGIVCCDCTSADHDSYTIWGSGSNGIACIGCSFGETTDNVLRIYSNKVLLSNCAFTSATDELNYVRLMGSGASMEAGSGHWITVSRCDSENCCIRLQNDSSVAFPAHVRIDANRVRGTHTIDSVQFAICAGDDVCVSNNRFEQGQSTTDITIDAGYNGNDSRYDRIRLLNNTRYYSGTAWMRFVSANEAGTFAVGSAALCANNILSGPSAADTTNTDFCRLEVFDSDFWTSRCNVLYAPSISRWGRGAGTSKTLAEFQAISKESDSLRSNPLLADAALGDLTLAVGSPCLGTGSSTVARWCRVNADGDSRTSMNIGAY